jgi:hypothetical protein
VPSVRQIQRCGELLLSYRLLMSGIEASPMRASDDFNMLAITADGRTKRTIYLESTTPDAVELGKRGTCNWWIPQSTQADIVALCDLSSEHVWLLSMAEVQELSKEIADGHLHLHRYVQPTFDPEKTGHIVFSYEFDKFLIDQQIERFFPEG